MVVIRRLLALAALSFLLMGCATLDRDLNRLILSSAERGR